MVFDGVVTQRLIDLMAGAEEEVYLIGARVGEIQSPSERVKTLTLSSLTSA